MGESVRPLQGVATPIPHPWMAPDATVAGMFGPDESLTPQPMGGSAPRQASAPADLVVNPVPDRMVENPLRGRLTDRLTLMAVRHCRQVEELQGSRRAIGCHALGFFYSADRGNGSSAEVFAATRLFFESEDTSNLLWILDTLIQRADEYTPGTFEPRIHLCNRVEQEMPASAALLGIGVTTVSAPKSSAATTAYAALGMDRPYQGIARMLDGTDLLLRCGGGFLADVDVRSTRTLDVGGRRTRYWRGLPPEALRSAETSLPEVLPRLSTLLDYTLGRSQRPDSTPDAALQRPEGRSRHRGRARGLRVGGLRSQRSS